MLFAFCVILHIDLESIVLKHKDTCYVFQIFHWSNRGNAHVYDYYRIVLLHLDKLVAINLSKIFIRK